MPLITDIQQQKRREERVSVYLDEEFWTGMPRAVAAEHDLRIGQQLTAEQQAAIELQLSQEDALQAATLLLSYRDRSEHEMRRRLSEKGFNEAIIDSTVARLQEYNYLDDRAFALQLAQQQHALGKGRRAAQYALHQAGVDPELAQVALEECYSADSEEEAALSWLRRRPLPTTPQDRQRLLRGLAGRGFSFDVAQAAIARRIADADSST